MFVQFYLKMVFNLGFEDHGPSNKCRCQKYEELTQVRADNRGEGPNCECTESLAQLFIHFYSFSTIFGSSFVHKTGRGSICMNNICVSIHIQKLICVSKFAFLFLGGIKCMKIFQMYVLETLEVYDLRQN